MKSRLKKLAEEVKSPIEEVVTKTQEMPNQMQPIPPAALNSIRVQVEQISDKGRSILKEIEEYKFFIEQIARAMKNNQFLAQMIGDKKSVLDDASQKIYNIVFEMENMDVLKAYENPTNELPNQNQDEKLNSDSNDKEKKDENPEKEEPKKESPSKSVNSPNDLINSDGKDPFLDENIEDVRDEKNNESEPSKSDSPKNSKEILPKQPTVQPQSKP